MYCAAPWATRRTFAYVKSSATTPRQPSVPNLIGVAPLIDSKVNGRPLSEVGRACLQAARLPGSPARVHHLADILGAGPRAHEYGVLGVHDDHVLEADGRHQAFSAEDEAARRVDEDRLTLHRVAARIGAHAIAHLRPVADVGPFELGPHEEQAIRLLQHAAVDNLHREPAVDPCGRL